MKLYVLARRDLSPAQQAVQSCHAVAELCLRHGAHPRVREWAEDHKTMVLLGVDGEAELADWESRLEGMGIPHATFVEPDIGGQRTAIAALPERNEVFEGLRLLGRET
jgi:peptidyl-tRNA hydrolase